MRCNVFFIKLQNINLCMLCGQHRLCQRYV